MHLELDCEHRGTAATHRLNTRHICTASLLRQPAPVKCLANSQVQMDLFQWCTPSRPHPIGPAPRICLTSVYCHQSIHPYIHWSMVARCNPQPRTTFDCYFH